MSSVTLNRPIIPKMALDIESYEAIAQLKEINGVSIAEIEKRARPLQYAKSGFIGKSENFKDVLQKDWKTVQALGTTHIELAHHLQAIWDEVEQRGRNRTVVINYCVNKISQHALQERDGPYQHMERLSKKVAFALGIIIALGAIIRSFFTSSFSWLAFFVSSGCLAYAYQKNKIVEGGQELWTRWGVDMGFQEDIFENARDRLSAKWNTELTITNSFNNLRIRVSGGTIWYIARFGFYEGGGEQNPYRVDPLKLVAILTGESLSSLQARINLRWS